MHRLHQSTCTGSGTGICTCTGVGTGTGAYVGIVTGGIGEGASTGTRTVFGLLFSWNMDWLDLET